MRTVIIIAIFAIITVIVGLLPANGADPFGHAHAPHIPAMSSTKR